MNLPKAFIVDIDGTISNGSHRQHFVMNTPKNWAAYNAAMHLDKPIEPVIDTIKCLALVSSIILCSGRQDENRQVTVEWLAKHGVPYTELFMRKTKDYRDDCIIKKEIYENLILPNYNVVAVFDDRVKVVNMWRSLGLYVFDCNETRKEF